MAQDRNLLLYVASYPDPTSARADFQVLKDAQGVDLQIVAGVVMSRDGDGKVDVLESGDGHTAKGAVIGGGVGVVLGLFAPPLLAATALGAVIGGVVGHLNKKHEEKQLGAEMEEYFPPNSSAVVVVIDDLYLDRVQKSLAKAEKSTSRPVDKDDVDQLEKAVAADGDAS